jgi:hypothetical protein
MYQHMRVPLRESEAMVVSVSGPTGDGPLEKPLLFVNARTHHRLLYILAGVNTVVCR